MIVRALSGRSKEEILLADRDYFQGSQKILAIAKGEYLEKDESDLHGTGYVAQSLEAALWCIARSVSFKDAFLRGACQALRVVESLLGLRAYLTLVFK